MKVFVVFVLYFRMRKEMVAKVNSVAAEFRKVSDLQMADTTKRTIQENVAINQQLSRMSDKVNFPSPAIAYRKNNLGTNCRVHLH